MGVSLTLVVLLVGLSTQVLSQPPTSCSNGRIFNSCGPACPKDCDNYQDDTACIAMCEVGCFCPEGQVVYGEGCVDPSECPTLPSACAIRVNHPNGSFSCLPDCYPQCSAIQTCEVVSVEQRTVGCKYSPYVLCGSDSFLVCDSEYTYCLQQNQTRRSDCIASCLSRNGGCQQEEVCITTVTGSGPPSVQCRDIGDFSTECPPGQVLNQCGAYCQETCEQRVSGEQFSCIEICGPPACVCPDGLLLFRDRCVDPRLCYALVTYPPAINPLPIAGYNQYLYSLFSSGSSISDFVEDQFLEAVRQLLGNQGFSGVSVRLHGIYFDDGLQIVIQLSGVDVNQTSFAQFTILLGDNSDQLPLPVDQVSIVDAQRRVDSSFWTACNITFVSSAGGVMVVLVIGLLVIALVACCVRSNRRQARCQPDKLKVEIHNLMAMADEELLGEKAKLEFES